MKLPIDIAWDRSPLDIHCPYNECGTCYYVGPEIQAFGQCPMCGKRIDNATTPWPTNQWFSAAADLAFLYDSERLELATIAAASYFEGCLHAFLWKGMYFIWDKTRWIPRDDQDQVENIKANRESMARIARLFDKNHGWKRRANTLCPHIFGTCFDGLVAAHVPDCRAFITNRDNIHGWRNRLVHAGHPMTETWPDEVKPMSLRATVEFMLQCWEVFRPLQNDLIATVVSKRTKIGESSNA